MRGIKAASDFRSQPGSTRWRERSLDRKELRKVGAGDIAHRDIEMAVGFAGLKDRNDVRMIDRGGQLRLPLESLLELRIATMCGENQLEGDGPVEIQLAGPIDDPHAALADDLLKAMPRDFGARPNLHGRSLNGNKPGNE